MKPASVESLFSVASSLTAKSRSRFGIEVWQLSVATVWTLIVAGVAIVEVKSVTKVLPIHRAQVLTYLKLLKLNLGFIINFNVERLRLGLHRIVLG